MTCFGPDVSSYQAGLDLSQEPDDTFVIAKATEGTSYTDADYIGFCAQAARLGRLFIWYHFLSGAAAATQAAHTARVVDSTVLPGMLDAEPAGTFRPTLAQIYAYIDAAHAAGLNLRLCYLPQWYWQELGEPSLAGLAERGVRLVSSQYPGGTGNPERLYPGDDAAGWAPYGGKEPPLIYQYTDRASDDGQEVDYNACRGTRAQLAADLAPRDPAPAPAPTPAPPIPSTTEDDDMPSFATGEIKPGAGAVTIVLPPPAHIGSAGWGDVWFSLGSNFGDAHVHVVAHVNGQAWSHDYPDVVVPAGGNRVNPFGGPLPTGVQKISITRTTNPDVPLAYLVEATHR